MTYFGIVLVIFVAVVSATFANLLICDYRCPYGLTPMPNINYTKTANGCGSKGIIVNPNMLPQPEMEQCCNDHDYCYDTCNSGKSSCDETFKTCLLNVCSKPTVLKPLICLTTAQSFYKIVRDLGCPSYISAQKKTCLC